ncbi:MAG: hypothetical protein K2X27_12410 [Candidatus Obscuribacterales bacterium]|nr:hypothetical protein [Candidatus Obscuribacterales bacterium]
MQNNESKPAEGAKEEESKDNSNTNESKTDDKQTRLNEAKKRAEERTGLTGIFGKPILNTAEISIANTNETIQSQYQKLRAGYNHKLAESAISTELGDFFKPREKAADELAEAQEKTEKKEVQEESKTESEKKTEN